MTQYRILAQLAKGGMGEILLARKLGAAGFERLVVLKRPLDIVHSPGTVRAVVEEARLLAQIHHPNVCHVYDLEEAGGELFFVMEFLDGISLWQFLDEPERAAPLPVPALCALFEQACDGLSAIHALGMVHRDISPSNVFATAAGVVKILDLGIARPAAAPTATTAVAGQVRGKRTYCAPEQLAGAPVDARSDLFSLGLVMHDVALARRPSRSRIGADAAIEVAALPADLAAIIARAAARDAGERFGSAAELGTALRRVATHHGGPLGRAELAGWLATRFATQLARQRAVVDRAAAAASEDATTRVLELRPAGLPHAAPEPAPPAIDRLPQVTEQLDKPGPRPRRRRWVPALLAAAALMAVAMGVVARRGGRSGPDVIAAQRTNEAITAPATPRAGNAQDNVGSASTAVRDVGVATVRPHEAHPLVHAPKHAASAASKPPRLRRADTADVEAPPAETFGAIRIDSQPVYATVDIDGHRVGVTPIKSWRLSAGRHRIHARRADGREQDIDVDIAADTQSNLPLSW